MSKWTVASFPYLSEHSCHLLKFYPSFWFGGAVLSEARRGVQPRDLPQCDSVFNIIFKKDYLVRYTEVSGQYRRHEARYHG